MQKNNKMKHKDAGSGAEVNAPRYKKQTERITKGKKIKKKEKKQTI